MKTRKIDLYAPLKSDQVKIAMVINEDLAYIFCTETGWERLNIAGAGQMIRNAWKIVPFNKV